MGSGSVGRFVAKMQAANDERYEPGKAYAELVVTAVETDSTSAVLAARGTIDGAGEDTVPMRGVSGTQVGDRILISYDKDNPAGAKRYERHVQAANPVPQLNTNPDLPDPQFAEPPFVSVLVASPGSITSSLTIFFLVVEDRFVPEGYTVSFRVAGGEWGEGGFVPHTGGVQQSRLGDYFSPGTFVDVRLRAHYAHNTIQSPGLDTRIFQTAVDDVSPGVASARAVSTATPGALVLTASGAVNDHFAGWLYEIATSSGGATIASAVINGPFTWSHAPGTFYAKATPVSKTGVPGSPFPGSGHSGPFTIADFAPPLDVTPPPDWAAPTLAGSVNQPANGGEQYWLTVTLPTSPAYGYPADYAYTLVRVSGASGAFYGEERIVQGATSVRMQVLGGVLLSVTLQGVDRLGNASSASPAATITITPTGAPSGTPMLQVAPFATGVVCDWTAVAGALGYEVQRAPDVGGSPGTFATLVQGIDALRFMDTLANSTDISPKLWYRVRAVNLAGSGPFSANQSATAGKLDGQNIRLNSLTVSQLLADQAMFNAIISGKVLSDKFITALSGARWELEGATGGGGAGQLRWYDATAKILQLAADGLRLYKIDGTTVKMLLDRSGLTFNDDSGVWVLRTGVAGGVGYLESAGGFQIRGDYTNLDLSNAQYMRWAYAQPDGLGHTYHQYLFLTRIRTAVSGSGVSAGIGLIGYSDLDGAGFAAPRIVFGYNTDPINTISNIPTDRVEMTGGTLTATQFLIAQGGQLFLGLAGKSLVYNAGGAEFDFDAPIRTLNGAAALKLAHQGTGGNALADWSHGSLYLGWFTNPGTAVVVGNGTSGGYGSVLAAFFTVSSSQDQKRNIRDLTGALPALRALRARRFKRVGDPANARDEFGFVAEEVEAVAPNAVVAMPGGPLREATEAEPDPPLGPDTKGLNVTTLLAVVARGVQEYMADTDQALATVRQQRDDLAGQLAALAGRVAALEAVPPIRAALAPAKGGQA